MNKCLGIEKLVEEINRLNLGPWLHTRKDSPFIYLTVKIDPSALILPDGYYYLKKINCITNKHNTNDDNYESFLVVPCLH